MVLPSISVSIELCHSWCQLILFCSEQSRHAALPEKLRLLASRIDRIFWRSLRCTGTQDASFLRLCILERDPGRYGQGVRPRIDMLGSLRIEVDLASRWRAGDLFMACNCSRRVHCVLLRNIIDFN